MDVLKPIGLQRNSQGSWNASSVSGQCTCVMVCRSKREAGRGGGGLHLSAVIFKEMKGGGGGGGGEANCIDGPGEGTGVGEIQ